LRIDPAITHRCHLKRQGEARDARQSHISQFIGEILQKG
jgi:hypothetical protein